MKIIINIGILLTAVVIASIAYVLFKRFFYDLFAKIPDTKQININFKRHKSYSRIQKYMASAGFMYYLNDYDMSPGKYLIIKVFVSIFGILISVLIFDVNLIAILLGTLLGYFGLDIYIKSKNKKDNEAIQKDINRVYIILNVSLNSNIYIVDALLKSSRSVKCQRLKDEIENLSQALSQKSVTSDEALESFEGRFTSPIIKSFVNLVRTYFLYGETDTYSQDLIASMANATRATQLKQNKDIENLGQLYTFLFVVVIIIAIIVVATGIFSGMQIF